jgi:transcriptional regulator with XRE-family HTH domain
MKPELRHNTFGQAIAEARRKAGPEYNLRYVSAQIFKEDGEPISHQYLSDLENDRRNPPSDYLIDQIATVLKVSRYYLYMLARRLPEDFPLAVSEGQAEALYEGIRKKLQTSAAA